MNTPLCPSLACAVPIHGPVPGRIVRAGFFYRKAARRKIQRFYCRSCKTHFSEQTLHPTYFQKRPDLNLSIRDLLCSSVSQRRCAKLLGINPKTVVRKYRFMARQAARENSVRQEELTKSPVKRVQFDDLITSIHTKCKPASVSLAVNADTREILGIHVSEIPARHPLKDVSLAKYGPRKDERPEGLKRLMRELRSILAPDVQIRSDCDPEYPKQVRTHLKEAVHERVQSRRGRSSGFGELKRIGFDPLFSLNHTCAMLRANLNRLARRTWCTSKTKIGLILHLELYRHYHNTQLI